MMRRIRNLSILPLFIGVILSGVVVPPPALHSTAVQEFAESQEIQRFGSDGDVYGNLLWAEYLSPDDEYRSTRLQARLTASIHGSGYTPGLRGRVGVPVVTRCPVLCALGNALVLSRPPPRS